MFVLACNLALEPWLLWRRQPEGERERERERENRRRESIGKPIENHKNRPLSLDNKYTTIGLHSNPKDGLDKGTWEQLTHN